MNEWLRRKFFRVGRSDRAVSAAIARIPVTALDTRMIQLTGTGNHSVLWLAVAGVLATRKGATRRGALRGAVSVAGASFTANVVLKNVFPRRRPPAESLPVARRLRERPSSSSFPSGHAASAAAFAAAVAIESPRAGLAVAPLAATVAYSRVHTGVHWTSDVLAGAAVGAAVAGATRRWWPVRESDQAFARPVREAPALAEGKGLVLLVNPVSGGPGYDPTDDVAEALPAATVVRTEEGRDAVEQLGEVLDALPEPASAVGVSGGDGTVAAGALVALRRELPFVVIPTGTLNHFARDVGVYDLREVVDATGTGEAVGVDIATVELTGCPDSPDEPKVHHWINTASLGAYPELVRLREQWEGRWGKWPAFAAALLVTLRRAEPLRLTMDGRPHTVWFVFVGNGPYQPRGAVPAWRSRLDSGLLDVRWLRADVRFSRLRAMCALALAALGHSRVYGEEMMRELEVTLPAPEALACDGEVVGEATRLRFAVTDPIAVYRRDEDNPRWSDRERPHHPG